MAAWGSMDALRTAGITAAAKPRIPARATPAAAHSSASRADQTEGDSLKASFSISMTGFMHTSAAALVCMDPVIEMLKDAFKLSPSVWSTQLALLCAVAGVVLAGLLGFAAAVTPAVRSASMDPQAAITQGEVN